MSPGAERAAWVRTRWHEEAHIFDRCTAEPALRSLLSDASWNDKAFQNLLVGLRSALTQLPSEEQARGYEWVLHRDAYDYIPEPLHQFVLLGVLRGLWEVCPESEQLLPTFADIVVRQPSGALLSPDRSEPVARLSKRNGLAWIYVPFAWDDMLQQSFEAILAVAGVDGKCSLEEACEKLKDNAPGDADWSLAHPIWNGLCAKAILGRLDIPHHLEQASVEDLCTKAAGLRPYRMNQMGADGQDLGNSLSHISRVYTIAHEATHILRQRQGVVFSQRADAERDADLMAMLALWNHGMPLNSEVREGQSNIALVLTSGVGFYLGLLTSGNLLRCVDEAAGVADANAESTRQHAAVLDRMRAWVTLADTVCDHAAEHGDIDAHAEFRKIQPLVRWVVAYCNALLDYGRQAIPIALSQASIRL